MGSLSNWLELELLDHVLKTGAYSVPTNIYVALSTADPTDAGSGIAEPSGDGYARVVMNSWDAAASRATENTSVITYAEAEASWGTISHFAIFDAITGGNFLAHGAFTTPKAIAIGANASIAAGDIDITFSAGGATDYLANALLDHVFKTSAYTEPSVLYMGASTADPGDDEATLAEPVGNGYARKQHESWDAASAGASENTGTITFAVATGSWGTLTYWCLFDHASAGNMLIYTALDSSAAIGVDDVLQFADGAADITLD